MESFRRKILAFFMISMIAAYVGAVKFAVADDDEEEDDDKRYEESISNAENSSSSSEETITETIRLPDKYVTKTIIENIIKKDSDRDGLLDENDPHPNIAEIYIVSDQNQNGIDDKYDLDSYGQ